MQLSPAFEDNIAEIKREYAPRLEPDPKPETALQKLRNLTRVWSFQNKSEASCVPQCEFLR
jgi:hypothetical protein